MPSPTFVAEYESVFNTNATPKTTSVTVAAGDILAVYGLTPDSTNTLATPTGGGLTYTLRQSVVVSNYGAAYLWTAVSASAQSFTLSITATGDNTAPWGFNCLRFSSSDGVGASSKTNTTGAPTLNITTTQANSAIVVALADWNAQDGTTRTWRTGAGTMSEKTFYYGTGVYSAYGGVHLDAGTVALKAVGLTAPTGQQYSIVACEITGNAPAAAPSPVLIVSSAAVRRASTY